MSYTNALAAPGKGRVLQKFPLVGGIDAAGVVERPGDRRFLEGDAAIATGWGLSVDQDGGCGRYPCLPGDWQVPCPAGLDLRSAMIIGTAGFTAALAIHRMQVNGQRPGTWGPSS